MHRKPNIFTFRVQVLRELRTLLEVVVVVGGVQRGVLGRLVVEAEDGLDRPPLLLSQLVFVSSPLQLESEDFGWGKTFEEN